MGLGGLSKAVDTIACPKLHSAILFVMTFHGIALILGGGPRVGQPIAEEFSRKGYRIAMARRSAIDGFSDDGIYHIKADLANVENVPSIFQVVEKALGLPNVVIYVGWFCLPNAKLVH